MNEKDKIWELIRSKDPTNITLAVELAEGLKIDLNTSELVNLHDHIYPFYSTIGIKEKLIKMLKLEVLSLTESPLLYIRFLPNLESLLLNAQHSYYFQLDALENCSQIETLSLKNYELKGIGKGFHKIKELKHLSLEYSKIEYLHPDIGKVNKLKRLYLKGCKFKTLGKELLKVKTLKSLFIYQEKMNTEFLDILAEMKQLKILKISSSLVKKTERERLRKALPNCRISYK